MMDRKMNIKSKIKYSLLLMIIMGVFFSVNVFGFDNEYNNEYEKISTKFNIPQDKVWTITFNKPVDSTVIGDKIKIKDAKGNDINIKIEMGESNNKIKIFPVDKYKKGDLYTIYVDESIKSLQGNDFLDKNVKMDFLVCEEEDKLPSLKTYDNVRELLQTNSNIIWDEVTPSKDMEQGMIENVDISFSKGSILVDDFFRKNDDMAFEEADTIKTDGECLYKVNKTRVEIIRIYPEESMQVVNTIDFEDKSFSPSEIYLHDDKLIVIGKYRYKDSGSDINEKKEKIDENSINPETGMPLEDKVKYSAVYNKNAVRTIVYDISDKSNIKKIRQLDVDGWYLTSRKIGNKLYVISNEYIDHNYIENGINITPKYCDSSVSDDYLELDCEDIRYISNFQDANFLIVSSIDMDDIHKKADFYACLGTGKNIFVSGKNIYVSLIKSKCFNPKNEFSTNNTERVVKDCVTKIYKFSLENKKFEFKTSKEIPGKIFSQSAIDEYNSNLRVVTSLNNYGEDGESIVLENNLYILDKDLNIIGMQGDIVSEEDIKSISFKGNRIYILTFNTCDTIFALDVSNPENPEALGYLNMPNFNGYIHPYDENNLIGIGYDTIQYCTKDSEGNENCFQKIESGLKISIYDVEDVGNVIEKYVTTIGDRGTYSEVLSDNKAFLFMQDKNLLAFPVTVMEKSEGQDEYKDNQIQYGDVVFQGAYVYNVDLNKGIELKGKISHISNRKLSTKKYSKNYDKTIQRILCINDVLYTVSNDIIAASDVGTLEKKYSLEGVKYLTNKDYVEFKYGFKELKIDEMNELNKGCKFLIELDESVSDGYKWDVSISDPEVVGISSEKTFDFDELDVYGNVVRHIWKFKSLEKGEAKIIFKYRRDGEEDLGTEIIEYNINVNN
jgi:uncharacterized secreted protein with C-terminal beta-propeller domain/predicted secreted protein